MSDKEVSSIKCQLCGVDFQKITNTHLQRAHPEWNLDKYCKEFGEQSLMSDEWRWIISQNSKNQSKETVAKSSNTIKEKQSGMATEFTSGEYQVVIGGLLGDAGIFDVKKIKYPPEGTGSTYFYMQHMFKQLPYMAWKARKLIRFNPVLYQRFKFNTVKRRFDTEQYVNTSSHFLFGDVAKEFYPTPDFKKVIPPHLIEKLDPLGLAIWYQDDGSYSSGSLEICTDAFSVDSVKQAASILTGKFGIEFKVYVYKDGIPHIALNKGAQDIFFELIEPFIHPTMLYKIGKRAEVVVEVTKRMKFEYGHYLLDYEGLCGRSHGHSALVEVTIKGPINPDTGMAVDFGDIKKIVQPILDVWDHDVLNDIDPILAIRPTAEVMATYLAATLRKYIPGLSRIKCYETDTSCVDLDVEKNSEYLEDFLQRLAEAGEWWQELKSASIKNSPFTNFWETGGDL